MITLGCYLSKYNPKQIMNWKSFFLLLIFFKPTSSIPRLLKKASQALSWPNILNHNHTLGKSPCHDQNQTNHQNHNHNHNHDDIMIYHNHQNHYQFHLKHISIKGHWGNNFVSDGHFLDSICLAEQKWVNIWLKSMHTSFDIYLD